METQPMKVFVAIGTDLHDGFSTLGWTIRKWSNHPIRIVILHAESSIRKDYVDTPLGKLPTSFLSEEKLKVLDKTEEANSDKIMSQYITFCGKVEAEVIKIEKNEQPLHEKIVEIISCFRITKLVMSFAFMKSSSTCKSRSAISGSYYVLRHKLDFCELFVICGGRLVVLRDESNEGLVDECYDSPSSSTSRNNDSSHQWEKYVNELLPLYEDEEVTNEANTTSRGNSTEICTPKNMISGSKYSGCLYFRPNDTRDAVERIQPLKCRIQNAQETIRLSRKQANADKERRRKAEWAIVICNTRAEEIEACINKEAMKNAELNKELDCRKDEINDLQSEVEEKKSKLASILDELQNELSNKLHLSFSSKACAEVQLEKAVRARADVVQEMEELRKSIDVLRRRIGFCTEKVANKNNWFNFDYREVSAAEIVAATENFSQRFRLKSSSNSKNVVYRGRINHITVAFKMYTSAAYTEVKFLGQIRHPNVLAMIGFCSELNCIVYEYMHNGSLHEALLRKNHRYLNWHTRIFIASQICSALGFLHKAKPQPIIHGNLNPSKILLDRNNVPKINSLKGPLLHDDKPDIKLDIRAFGDLLVQLLTGKNCSALIMNNATVIESLDHSAGEWPMDLATELCDIAIRCLSDNTVVEEPITEMLVKEVTDVKKRADELVVAVNGEISAVPTDVEDWSNVPSAFLCPIYQDVMQNPHVAADGFSYELESIDEWLKTGHDTSPMTNLRLMHKILTPNHTLRSLIQEWQNKRVRSHHN